MASSSTSIAGHGQSAVQSILTRYAIYTRQSSSDAGKVLSSCEAQFSICQDFVKTRAAPRCKWIGERFDDTGVSGVTRERPAFELLMALVRAGKVGKVVVYRLDRLSRTLRDCLAILETFREVNHLPRVIPPLHGVYI